MYVQFDHEYHKMQGNNYYQPIIPRFYIILKQEYIGRGYFMDKVSNSLLGGLQWDGSHIRGVPFEGNRFLKEYCVEGLPCDEFHIGEISM